ncbi:MAG: OmpA family protein [Bacteroidota bacterium]
MKIVYCFLIALLFVQVPCWGQNSLRKQADKAYLDFHYTEAIKAYLQVVEEEGADAAIEEKLATSYRKINDSKNAEIWYAKVVNQSGTNPGNILHYAQALAMNGKYEASQDWYKRYAQLARGDQRGATFSRVYQDTAHFHQDAARYQIELAPFNSEQADFSPTYYRQGILFCSNRETEKKSLFRKKYNWNNTNFLDLYFSKNRFSQGEKFQEELNSKYHEGPSVFYNNERNIAFTRNNYHKGKFKKSSDDINKLKLFFAEVEEGEWKNIVEFPFNDDEYSVGHPAISSDGTTLYFVSDMPGSVGGTDLFMSTYEGDTWSVPKNLGPMINTKGDEMFPFVDANNNLYFASTGHGGLGGLDIFFSPNINGRFGKPENMGVPINSNQDDFGLIIDVDGYEGYFSSNRAEGVGDDDIYKFLYKTCELLVVVVDSTTNQIVPDAELNFTEKKTQREVIFLTEAEGVYSFITKLRTGYVLKAYKEGYQESIKRISEQQLLSCQSVEAGIRDTIKIYLKKGEKTLRPQDPNNPNSPQVAYNSQPPAWQRLNYNNLGLSPEDVYQVKNIYYDLDKYYIRPDASVELNNLLGVLYQYPSLRVLLSSHTDSRASYGYNVRLSQRRSQSARQFLVNRGVAPHRISITYYGETKLNTNCPDGVPCNESDHQLNRRTEIILLK